MGFPEGVPFPAPIEVGMGRTGKSLRSRLMRWSRKIHHRQRPTPRPLVSLYPKCGER
jgi:hypothetical protein